MLRKADAKAEAPLAPPKSNAGRPAEKRSVVLRLPRGEPVDAVSREVGVTIAELEQWRALALAGMEADLKTRTDDPLKARLNDAVRRVGENEILSKERELQARRPLTGRRSSTSAARSPSVQASPLDCNGFARRSNSRVRRSMPFVPQRA
ncbi:hypothetical protein [Paraburkholderia strydomiana]|jgi:transposase|uniref:Transposase n=2 Tax=Paraburkholderia strydomiana TaxID=1245417 RepID=A0ABW9CCC8_9BURK